MDEVEARQLAEARLAELRQMTYDELLAADQERREVVGPSGVTYQVVDDAFWDSRRDRTLRVVVAVDDGHRAWRPLTVDFIVAPDGTYIGE